MSGLVGVAALLTLLALGVPIGIAMGAVGLIGMMILLGPEPALIKSTVIFFEAVTRFELGVLPLFLLMAHFCFAAGASRTIAADTERVRAAFLDAALRERWLPAVGAVVRSGEQGRTVRLDLADGTRLQATLGASGPARTAVAVEQSRMTDPAAVAPAKAYWKERLEALKRLLEE